MHTLFNDGVITIRPFEPEDLPSFYSVVRASAEALGRWMPWCHAEYSKDEAKMWLETCQAEWARNTSYPFLIIDSKNHEVMGSVDINQINKEHNFGNIGYWVSSAQAARGVATAAVKMAARFGFIEVGFARLEIVVDTNNVASRRVAEKAGAKLECIARNRLAGWGRSHDAAVYSLIPADFGLTLHSRGRKSAPAG
jgi:ribosomal-protein-serine acetyltransferase